MKKQLKWIIAALAVTAVATPALAEDGIKFYGSVRLKTNYVVMSNGPVSDQATDDAQFALQANSRFGANVTTGPIGGKVELGLRGVEYGTTTSLAVYTRLLYGTYKTEGGNTILVGQTYAPYWTAYGHVYKDDDMFTGFGNLYEGRTPMIKVDMASGLYFAALQNKGSDAGAGTATTKTLLPKLNVGFKNTAGALSYNTGIAYQQYDSFATTKDIVTSYLGYFEAVVKGEGMTAQAKLHYGQNLREFGFTTLNKAYSTTAKDNVEAYGGVAQLNIGNACAGFSYTVEDVDAQKANKDVAAFINYTIPVVKGFTIVPELAYFDYNVNAFDFDGADEVAATIKWQMDF